MYFWYWVIKISELLLSSTSLSKNTARDSSEQSMDTLSIFVISFSLQHQISLAPRRVLGQVVVKVMSVAMLPCLGHISRRERYLAGNTVSIGGRRQTNRGSWNRWESRGVNHMNTWQSVNLSQNVCFPCVLRIVRHGQRAPEMTACTWTANAFC